MAVSEDALIWIDLEMTGLDPQSDHIIEIATVVTDSELNELAEGPVLAVHQADAVLEAMGLDTDPGTLNLRIDARAAQAALLQEASFGTDTTRALKAKRRANAQINTCRLLLLDG